MRTALIQALVATGAIAFVSAGCVSSVRYTSDPMSAARLQKSPTERAGPVRSVETAGPAVTTAGLVSFGPSDQTESVTPHESGRRERTLVGTGDASFYGGEFDGRRTANGERFDMHAFTAAHRTLPFGTLLLVTNLDNGKSVTVRVNDRGPGRRDRVIDLSYAAAREIGMVAAGVVRVRVEKVGD